jgi:hypothetical protein
MAKITTTCSECGETFETQSHNPSKFCCSSCRKTWQNRRMLRGAILYDMMMEHRYNRKAEDSSEIRNVMYSLLAEWRAEDQEERIGKRTWLDPRAWIAKNPWLKALRLRAA